MKKIALLALAAVLAHAPATLAQDRGIIASRSPNTDLTPQQQAQLNELAKALDAQVLQGFKGRESLKSAMEADMKRISMIKDRAALGTAVTEYQTKYSKDYRVVLQSGGVDMNRVAADLQRIFPGSLYVVENGTHLVSAKDKYGNPIPPPPPPPQPSTRTLRDQDYEVRGDTTQCGAIQDSRVEDLNRGVINWTWAAKAGGCRNVGTMTANFEVPDRMKARVEVRADYLTEAFAIGISGVGHSKATTNMSVSGPGVGRAVEDARTTAEAFAPLFWVARDRTPRPTAYEAFDILSSGPMVVTAATMSKAWAAAPGFAAANSESSIKNLNIVINFTAR